MECSLIDICVIILFQKKSNFPVTACDLIFCSQFWLQAAVRSSHRKCSRLYWNEAPTQVFCCETCLDFARTNFEQHLVSCAIWSLGVVAYKCHNIKNKNLNLTILAYQEIEKLAWVKSTLTNLASISLLI